MPRIIFDPSKRIRGSTSQEDFSVSLALEPRVVPAGPLILQQMPGGSVYTQVLQLATQDVVATFSGNAAKAYLKVEDTENLEVIGLRVRKKKNAYMNGELFKIQAGNRFGEREYQVGNTGFADVAAQPSGQFTFAPESLAARATALLTKLIKDYEPGAASQDLFLDGGVYGTTVPGGISLTVNPTRFLPGLDMSGVSTFRSGGWNSNDTRLPAVLISPQHFVCAAHIQIVAGTLVVFRRRDGTFKQITVTEVITHPSELMDLRVGLLSEPVYDCETYAALPEDWAKYLPMNSTAVSQAHSNGYGVIPVISRLGNPGQVQPPEEPNNIINTNSPHLKVQWLGLFDMPFTNTDAYGAIYKYPQGQVWDSPLLKFYRVMYGGDSGSPHFMLVPGADDTSYVPALMSVTYSSSGGPCIPVMREWINEAMTTLSSNHGRINSYRLGTVDLSDFPKYL